MSRGFYLLVFFVVPIFRNLVITGNLYIHDRFNQFSINFVRKIMKNSVSVAKISAAELSRNSKFYFILVDTFVCTLEQFRENFFPKF